MKNRLLGAFALCAAVFVANEAGAKGVFEVYNEIDLTNALANTSGNSDTTIKIHPGVYDVSDIAMSAGSHLAVATGGVGKRTIYGMGDGPEDVVLAGRGMDSGSGLRVLTTDGYSMVSNLTITGGCSGGAGGGVNTAGYGLWNCHIISNSCIGAGGGSDMLTARNCVYIGNRATNGNGGGGRFSSSYKSFDCVFSNNYCTALGGGVSLGTHTNARFYDNTARGCGGVHSASVVGGTFIGNRTWSTGGGAAHGGGGSVTNAYFCDNVSTNASSGSHSGEVAYDVTFDDCTFENHIGKDDMFKGCTFRRCTIRTLRESGVHRDVLNACHFYNSLLVDVEHLYSGGSVGTFATVSSFDNCTIVGFTNTSTSAGNIMGANCRVVNTIFDALSPVGMASTYTLPMTNCLWTAQKNTDPPVGSFGGGLVSREALKFTDAQNGDFTLKRSSKARNAGYQDDDYLAAVGPVDRNGDPRVYEGDGPAKAIIDVGCYECQIPAPGLMMLVK